MGDKNFRLTPDVRPERYRFLIVPDLAAATFRGSGSVELALAAAASSLTLHGVHLAVSSARVQAAGRTLAARVTTDEDSQTLRFDLDGAAPPGTATLEVEWTGILHKDLRGFYLAGGIGVTQFEAADARRVFPCFDEPPFKAVWELSIEAPADLAVLSNGRVASDEKKGDRRTVRFQATPLLSSYLVAMIVGKLASSEERTVSGIPIRTWATPEKVGITAFAQECAAAVLPLLEDYFGVPYVFGKLDQIGVPDFEAGAMENAGCITFREIALLIDPARTPLPLQKRVAEVITHELAHQWFGNLVTMQWWDDLWLNEAFATWMAFKIVDQWRPGWRMWDDFEGGKVAAMHLDSIESTHPIRAVVHNADQATENFDLITYEKGGAMLRMIEGYLGADRFRDGIRAYMHDHTWGNTVADDLWRALARASGQPIDRLANDWIGRPGFPLVEVTRDGGKLRLTQRRFHADPEKFKSGTDAPWLVPVVVRWADDGGVHESLLLLGERSGELALDARGTLRFACANAGGAGFYRVKYAPDDLQALARHRHELTPVERTSLVSDAAALFYAGAGPLSSLLDLLVAFAGDEDYTVLGQVVSGFDAVERRLAREEDRAPLRRIVEELVSPHLAALGYDAAPGEPDDRRLRRAAAVRALAGVARSPSVMAELASRLPRAWRGEPALEANLLDSASVAAARTGDAALFGALLGRATTHADPSEKRRALVSLASFESPALVERAVALVLGDEVPMQDVTIFAGVLLANRAARDLAWKLLRDRWPEVRKKLSPSLMRRMVENLTSLAHRRAEVEAFLEREAESFATVPQVVRQTREQLRLDEDARRRGEVAVAEWLAKRKKQVG